MQDAGCHRSDSNEYCYRVTRMAVAPNEEATGDDQGSGLADRWAVEVTSSPSDLGLLMRLSDPHSSVRIRSITDCCGQPRIVMLAGEFGELTDASAVLDVA